MGTVSGKSILVTGAAGFVGSHIARRLVSEGAKVHALVRPGSDLVRLRGLAGVQVHEIDLNNREDVFMLLKNIQPEGVFHLAGISQSYGSVPTLDALVDGNIRATLSLMDAMDAFPYEFFVNTDSFVSVGSKAHPIREDDALEPTELYGLSRIPATLYAGVLARTKGKPMVTVRVFTPYGPYVQKGKILYNLITQALEGQDFNLTSPSVTRDFIYIDDLVEVYLRSALAAAQHPGEVFNGGSGKASSLEDIVRVVSTHTGTTSVPIWSNQSVSYDAMRWEADTEKIQRELGFAPKTSLDEGIQKTVAWFRAEEAYWKEA